MTIPPSFRPRKPGHLTPHHLYILAVEDDPNVRAIIELSLRLDPRMAVRTVGHGWEAIEEVQRSPVSFDLVLLDGILPDMSGVALIEALHGDTRSHTLPVVILTAMRTVRDLDRLADAGAIAVMEKPFDPIVLADRLREHLARRDSGCFRWWAGEPTTR